MKNEITLIRYFFNSTTVTILARATFAAVLFASTAGFAQTLVESSKSAESRHEPDRKIVYKSTPQGELKLHLFQPQGWKQSDRRGAIVFFFGGGWVGGAPSQFYPQARQLADKGLVAISAEYRVSSRHQTSPFECVEDGKSAIRFVRAHADELGIDPERVAAAGGSAGGHVAACSAVIREFDVEDSNISSVPKVVIAFNPVIDTGPKGYGRYKLKKRYREISPVEHVRAGQPPMLIFHGTADTTVPFENAERFGHLMLEAGNECEIVPFKDMPHGFFNYGRNENKPYIESMKRVEEFLGEHGFFEDEEPQKQERASSSPKRPNGRPANFIIFLADDMGHGDAACYGHPKIQTPNLDAFAKQGLRLTNCYAADSVCSPSRSGILTGRTPYRNGVWRWIPDAGSRLKPPRDGSEVHLRRSEITVATLLKKRGYQTCHSGKWHLNGFFNMPEQPQPDDHGYDWWFATQNNAHPSHRNPTNFVRNGKAVGPLAGFSAPLVAEEAIDWITNQRDKSKPFFMTVWTHEPHLPIESDPKFMDMYKEIENPGIRQHHGNITQLDAAFGRLMKTLDEQGLADNTFVMFTSDNGPEGSGKGRPAQPQSQANRTWGSTGGLRGRKRDTWEGGIRVPGIVRWPGKIDSGTVSDVPVYGCDIFSTVCDIAGIPLPSDRVIDGASMVPLFANKPIARTQPMYWRNAFNKMRIAIIDGDWKIIGNKDRTRFELYNLREDRAELNDVSATHAERFERMKQQLIEQDVAVMEKTPDWKKVRVELLDRMKLAK